MGGWVWMLLWGWQEQPASGGVSVLPPQADYCRPRRSEMQISNQKPSPTSGTSHTITGPFSSGPPCMCVLCAVSLVAE